MLQNVLVIVLCVFFTLGLNGILRSLSGMVERLPSFRPPPGKKETPPEPSSPAPTGSLKERGFAPQIIAVLTEPGWAGIVTLAALASTSVLTAYIVLFIDLDLPVMLFLSAVCLVTAYASAVAIGRRRERGAWLPVHEEIPRSAPPEDCPVPEPGSIVTGAAIPEEKTLATLEQYWVAEPYSFVKIVRTGNQGFVYTVVEPAISVKEKTLLQETYAHLRDIIIYDSTEQAKSDHLDQRFIAGIIRQFDPSIGSDRLSLLHYYLKRDLSGYGPLEALMQDPELEDISCNGNNLPVFIFHKIHGSLPTNVVFGEGELNQFVLKLAQKANKQISLSNPMVDATLPNGARVQITYSDVVSTKGSSFTIRKFRAEPMTPLDLIRLGTFSAETLAYLWLAIEYRKSLLVAGGTASGKTSTMNAISLFIPQNAKVVSLEDTREIQLPHKNWLPTQTREINADGIKGDIDLFSLLKASMRQRPEYIIVGEVRGREAQTLFQAMNTGHSTLSTIHAGTVHEAINRLTHDPINVPPVMFQALDIIIIQSIYTLGNTRIRRNMSIHEIVVDRNGEINPVQLFEWDLQTDTYRRTYEKSRVLEEIAFHCGWDAEELERQIKKREEFFMWALEVEPPTITDLANAIHDLGE
jgi:archaeal flagellar protein FlaI